MNKKFMIMSQRNSYEAFMNYCRSEKKVHIC